MNAVVRGSCLLGMGILVVFSGRLAHAADGPLLIVVEAPPALDADAAEIRKAIGAELRVRTIAPMSTPSEPPGRALIVALDRDRIAMSLRATDGGSIGRVIPAPAEHDARLRAIAWLAGNLARDQVSPILAEGPPESSPVAALPPPPVTEIATETPPAPAASTPRPALPSNPSPPASDAGGTTISVRADPQSPRGPLRWSISGAIGPVIADVERTFGTTDSSFGFQPSTAWQITVQRRREHERLVIGGTLEGTYNHAGNGQGPQLIGVNLFVGADWRVRYCRLEATIGAGPEAGSLLHFDGSVDSTPPQSSLYYTYQFDLFVQGTLAAAIPLAASWEGVLQLGIHLNSSEQEHWFTASTIGLRYTLP
jgi:hypothetical protein